MESDLRTPAARLRAGLDNLSAIPPDPGARPAAPGAAPGPAPGPRTRPRGRGGPGGGLRGGGAPARVVAEPEPAAAPRPGPPHVGGAPRRRYVLRRKLEPLACWPSQYAR